MNAELSGPSHILLVEPLKAQMPMLAALLAGEPPPEALVGKLDQAGLNEAAIRRRVQNAAKNRHKDLARIPPSAIVPASINVRQPKLTRHKPIKP